MNGGWSNYGAYGKCSKSCGQGIKTRSRKCNSPAPKNGGKACAGSATDTGEPSCADTYNLNVTYRQLFQKLFLNN